MSQVEDGDLDIRVSMAVVLSGKYRDLLEIRRIIREKITESEGARFIHGTISSVPLYIIKEREWTTLRGLEQHGGERRIG
jgi:hypothetical protein